MIKQNKNGMMKQKKQKQKKTAPRTPAADTHHEYIQQADKLFSSL